MPEAKGRQVPTHFLRPNESVRVPSAYMVLDTETTQTVGEDQTLHQLRLWCARRRRRDAKCPPAKRMLEWSGHTATELAQCCEDASAGCPNLWVYCHNLSFDLAASYLPVVLCDRGWEVTQFAVTGDSPWLRLKRGRRRLTLVDSWGWLRKPLESIGEDVGISKPELPQDDDSEDAWWRRCWGDVNILDAALTELMDWWERNELGIWSLTGSATGWNAMRHRSGLQRILVRPDPVDIAEDRLAIYGGRRDTWWIGPAHAGSWVDWDFRSAYATVAANLLLPRGRALPFDSLPVDSPWIGGNNKGVIARVRVRPRTPRYPVRWHGEVFYPVGEFWTWLADPEIVEARERGELLEVGPGHVHWLGDAMQGWARWLLAVDDGTAEDAPPMARLAAHHWGRAVIGKWAQHGFDTERVGPAPVPGWALQEGIISGTRDRAAMIDIGGQRWNMRAGRDGDNAYPAILAWVESATRLRLGRVIDAARPFTLTQCDTDGLILAAGGMRSLEAVNALTAPLVLRRKRSIQRLGMWGPQHLETDGRRRFSGLSARAVEQDPGRFIHRGWPKLAWQMSHGDPAGYVQADQTWLLQGPYVHRWVLESGATLPPYACPEGPSGCELMPFSYGRADNLAVELAPGQHPLLAPLLTSPQQ